MHVIATLRQGPTPRRSCCRWRVNFVGVDLHIDDRGRCAGGTKTYPAREVFVAFVAQIPFVQNASLGFVALSLTRLAECLAAFLGCPFSGRLSLARFPALTSLQFRLR